MAVETKRPASYTDESASDPTPVYLSVVDYSNAYDNNAGTYATFDAQAANRVGDFPAADARVKFEFTSEKANTWSSWTLNVTWEWDLTAGTSANGSSITINFYDGSSNSLGSYTLSAPSSDQTSTTRQITGTGNIPTLNGGYVTISFRSASYNINGTSMRIVGKVTEIWVDGQIAVPNSAFLQLF